MSSDGSTLLFGALPAEQKLSRDEKRNLKIFFGDLCKRVSKGGAVACLLAGDDILQRLNAQFRGRDYPTDVLSFPSGGEGGLLGDLAISVERAAAQAAALGHTRMDEIRVLMLHGVLHLTGLDHERDGGEMARAEQIWRAEFGLPLTLTERSGAEAAHP